MQLDEATLVTPIFNGSEEENSQALGTWQSFLYTCTSIGAMTNEENKKALAGGMMAKLGMILNPPSTLPAVQTPMSPVFTPSVQSEPSNVVDLSFESVQEAVVVEKKKVAFDHNRALELAGLKARM